MENRVFPWKIEMQAIHALQMPMRFIAVSESETSNLKTGDQVTVVVLERRYL
jgi:Cu/Ag efflux protein CusF